MKDYSKMIIEEEMFDALLGNVALYSAEIRRCKNEARLDKIKRKYVKWILGLDRSSKKSTTKNNRNEKRRDKKRERRKKPGDSDNSTGKQY